MILESGESKLCINVEIITFVDGLTYLSVPLKSHNSNFAEEQKTQQKKAYNNSTD